MKIIIDLAVFSAIALLCWIAVQIIIDALQKYEQAYVQKTSRTLTGLFIHMDPKRLFYLNVASTLMVTLVIFCLIKNPFISAVIGALCFFLPKAWIQLQKTLRLAKFESQLVDTIVMMANALRSGMNVFQAVELIENEQDPPISQEFGLVLREYKVGVHLEDALEHLAGRVANDDLNIWVICMNSVLDTGGNLPDMLDTLAEVIRERKKLGLKIQSATAQGKMQALVVTFLPLGIGLVMYWMDPPMMLRMFNTSLGMIMLGVMVTLQVLGYFMIRKITALEH
jgi:tight adherence protein B